MSEREKPAHPLPKLPARPLVGIALALYEPNIGYLVSQLQSILAQDYENWFCVITSDSSLEPLKSASTLKPFFDGANDQQGSSTPTQIKQLRKQSFYWIQNTTRLGTRGNFEAAIAQCVARGADEISPCDQDDIWHSDKLSKSVALLQEKGRLSLVHTDMWILQKKVAGSLTQGAASAQHEHFSQQIEFTRAQQTAWQLERRGITHTRPLDFFIRNIAAGAGMLFDAELARRFPHIPEAFECHDHWYALVASYFGGVHPLAQPIYDYRIHGDNIVGLSTYPGFFNHSVKSRKLGVVRKLKTTALGAAAHCRAAVAAGLPVSKIDRLIAYSRFDFGVGFLLKGLSHLFNDRALARACIARAAGKVLLIVTGP